MTYAVPVVVPSMVNGFGSGGRSGMGGLRVDSKGNLFTCMSLDVPGLTPDLAQKIKTAYPDIPQSQWCAYATPDLAKRMHEGMGHTSESTAVKFAKYGPDGSLLWISGRKATAATRPGEMYHFWVLAGMVGDDYVVGASEWGFTAMYTSDGYFVDALMYDPNQLPPAGPYTFGSETFGGRVQAYPKLGQVWAYNEGGLYQIDGFNTKLHVIGEKRFGGSVDLDKVYGDQESPMSAATLAFARINDPTGTPQVWDKVAESDIQRGGALIATVKLGYDAANLYAKFHVTDATPLVNIADDIRLAFKGGDAAVIDIGPSGHRQAPIVGDVRFVAAVIGGKPRLIAMKAVSNLAG